MQKIIKNTTASTIFINEAGVNILAGTQIIIDPSVYYLWEKPEMITEISANVDAGNLVINNGIMDLSPADGLRFLQFPDRIIVKKDGSDVTEVVTSINFTGNASVVDNGNGAVTVNVTGGSIVIPPLLREVTMVIYPGVGFVDVSSGLLFEADPENDTILFLGEEIV